MYISVTECIYYLIKVLCTDLDGGDLEDFFGDLLLRKPSSRPSFHFVKGERDLSRKPCGGGGGRRTTAAVRPPNPGGGEGYPYLLLKYTQYGL